MNKFDNQDLPSHDSSLKGNVNKSIRLIAKSLAKSVMNNYLGVEIPSLPLASQVNRSTILEMAYLCRLAYMAYEQTPLIVTKLLTSHQYFPQYSFDQVHFLYNRSTLFLEDVSPCCGYAATTEKEIFIVLRGTKNIDDWLMNFLVNANEQGIHSGFSHFADSIWIELHQLGIIPWNLRKKIVLVGHSLGGAAVTLIAHRFGVENWRNYRTENKANLEVFTFGSPPISTQPLTVNANLYRIRNRADLVPYLPQLVAQLLDWFPYLPSGLSDYQHLWPEYLINQDTEIYQLPESEAHYFWNPYTIMELLKQLEPQEQNSLQQFVYALARYYHSEHRMLSYIEKLNRGSVPQFLQ